MPHSLLLLLPLLVFVAIIPLVIWGLVATRQRIEDNLRLLAGQLGLNFQPAAGWTNSPRLAGALRGKPAEVFTYTTGSGKSQQTWAALTVRADRGSGLVFKLRPQGFETKVMEFFGQHEITVGDPAFDAAWFVQTNEREFLGAALIPELREKLMVAQRTGARGKFELENGVVKYTESGTFDDAARTKRYAELADVMTDLADVAEVFASLGK